MTLILFYPCDIAHTGFAVISVLSHEVSLNAFSICFCSPVSFTIESFLRNRSSHDHEATAMMKAQFMSLWDGLDTSAATQVKTITLPPSLLTVITLILLISSDLGLDECVLL